MKITVLSTVHKKEDNRIFFKEIKSLSKKYSDINFIVSSEETEPFLFNGIRIDPLPFPKNLIERLIKNQITAYRIIKKRRPDVLHIHDPELILLAWFLKKKFKIKIVFDIHENVHESLKTRTYIPKPFRKIVADIYSFIEKQLIKDFDELLIAEKSYRKIYGIRPTEILNYPLSANISDEKDFNGVLNFAYVGGITESRCIFETLTIFSSVLHFSPDSKLYVIGPFVSSELENKVKNRIEELKISSNVVITGFINLDEIYKILQHIHIGFSLMKPLPNYTESLSTKIFDYMANQMVYFVSDFQIYDEYTVKSQTGYSVNCDDFDKIIALITNLFENRNILKQMARRGTEKVNESWNWLKQEEKLINLYSNI